MRVEILKQPSSGLIPTSWIVSMVGGNVAVLLLIFALLAPPWYEVYDPDFPRAADAKLYGENFDIPVIEIHAAGDVYLNGELLTLADIAEALDQIEDIEPGLRFHLKREAPWIAVRQSIQSARKAGAAHVEFVVRKDAGLLGVVSLDSREALPDLPQNATAQTFIDALTKRR